MPSDATPPESISARRVVGFRPVAAVFVALLVLGFALGVVVYRRYVAYEAVAARHVPEDVLAAVRVDLTHVMLYEPFRRSIFPLVDRLPEPASEPPRRERLEARGVRIGGDVREVVLGVGPLPVDWILIVGGRLPRTGLGALV